jgi:hypothetical protein
MSATVEFARMNGLGNKILVVDMRGRTDKVTPAGGNRAECGGSDAVRPDHGDP